MNKMVRFGIGLGVGGALLVILSKLTMFKAWMKRWKVKMIDFVMDKKLDGLTKQERGLCEIGHVKRGEEDPQVYRYFKNAPDSLAGLYGLAKPYGNDEAVVYLNDKDNIHLRMTFEMVIERSMCLKRSLEEIGVKKGDHVAILMANVPEFPLAFVATTSLGAVAVALNAFWAADMIQFGLTDSQSSVLIVDEPRLERLRKNNILEKLLHERGVKVVLLTQTGRFVEGALLDFHTLVEKGKRTESSDPWTDLSGCEHNVDAQDIAAIMYTSGTTSGRPKGVMLSHESFIQATFSFVLFTELLKALRGPSKIPRSDLITSPFFHSAQFSTHFLLSFIIGSKLVLLPKWDVPSVVNAIVKEKVTYMGLMPTMLGDLLNSSQFKQAQGKLHLTNVGTGGMACPSELMQRLHKMVPSTSIGSGWGLTETNAQGTAIGGPVFLENPLSCGRAHRIVDVKVVDVETGQDISDRNIDGELCLRSICNMKGYWGLEKETKEMFYPGGWLRTGDIGHIDENGYVFITDRLKDLVIRGGENISCCEVEDVIHQMDPTNILEVCVFGLPHKRYGEQLCAAICFRDPTRPGCSPNAIQQCVAQSLAKFKVPSQVFIRDGLKEPLPRSSTGKILKRDLRLQYLGQMS